MIIVPLIIMRTFQLMVTGSSLNGTMPAIRYITATDNAICGLYLGFVIMAMYMTTNNISASIFTVIS